MSVLFCWSYVPFGTKNTRSIQFSALISYMLWIIELELCSDFGLPYYRSSLSVGNFRQFLWELCPLLNLEYWEYTVFRFLFARFQTGRIMVWWCMSGSPNDSRSNSRSGSPSRVSVRQSVFRTFSYMLWHIEAEVLHVIFISWTLNQVRVSSISVNFCWSYAPLWTNDTKIHSFSVLFSYILRHIELKFCIWFWFTVLQIKF